MNQQTDRTLGTPEPLFSVAPLAITSTLSGVAPDGRFLFSRAVRSDGYRANEVILMQNFAEQLKTKVTRP